MKIEKAVRLKDIQSAFTEEFPFLRIEFYEEGHGPGEGSPRGKQLDPDLSVDAANGYTGDLTFDPEMQINAFESMMKKEFSLNVQVFRKSGNIWLQTITTDNWTLGQADRKGGHSSKLYSEKYGED